MWCNTAFSERTAYGKAELDKKSVAELCPDAENEDRFRLLISETVAGKEVSEFDVAIQSKEFERIELATRTAASRDSAGLIAGIVCFCNDVTAQRRLEADARQAAQEQRALFDLSSLPIFGVDHRGAVDVWNARLAAVTGISSQVRWELGGAPLATFLLTKISSHGFIYLF